MPHNSVEFSLPFEGDDDANFDYTFPQPPPEQPVPAPSDVPVCNDDGAGSKRTRKQKSRQPATIDASVVTTARRGVIDFDDKGFPVGDNPRRFINYLGIQVRNQVPITHQDWRKIDKVDSDLKNNLWTQAMVNASIH